MKTARLFAWDLALFILWTVAFGVFAAIFLRRAGGGGNEYKGSPTALMKGAVWVDLANALLWLVSGTYGFAKTFLGEKIDGLGGKVAGKLFDRKKQPATDKFEMYGGV